VGKALGFLSVVVKMGSHKQLFEAQQTLEDFCRLIILPNMTIRRKPNFVLLFFTRYKLKELVLIAREEEMFEDDPMEFIRQDLESSTGKR
jgi:exportin-2 (importin alpha re-exporter)